jgi:nucleotide-binding universal stress UspA family protein
MRSSMPPTRGICCGKLVEAARDVEAGLIVVGARGGDFVARTLRGSVGERLVARAPCDLLIVR